MPQRQRSAVFGWLVFPGQRLYRNRRLRNGSAMGQAGWVLGSVHSRRPAGLHEPGLRPLFKREVIESGGRRLQAFELCRGKLPTEQAHLREVPTEVRQSVTGKPRRGGRSHLQNISRNSQGQHAGCHRNSICVKPRYTLLIHRYGQGMPYPGGKNGVALQYVAGPAATRPESGPPIHQGKVPGKRVMRLPYPSQERGRGALFRLEPERNRPAALCRGQRFMIVQRVEESNSSLKKPAVVRASDHIRGSLDKQRRNQVARTLGPRRRESQTENSDTAKLTRTTTKTLPSTHPTPLILFEPI